MIRLWDHWLVKFARDVLVGVCLLVALGWLTLQAADTLPMRPYIETPRGQH